MKALPAAALLALLATTAAQAADPNLGRNLAATCANCHGTNGKAVAGSGMGSLAGENKANMLQKLTDFRNGDRPSTIMQQIAKGYSEAQLTLIADYFAAQK
ncbi:hypothetical protein MASR1M42_18870 [Azonexus hydrophilus]|jgi:cytochrome subunit of sulfide dehydrogenase|uniref:c-type cytochrome n=1 Tax=Azonexus hydrophilus TaxID=418702 RepID=UPI00176C37DB|nr:c-type cytochrome [Azonexus hydrophilus]MDX9737189.1 c-type cytochrome [Azonexus sp.]HHV49840.1 cytochrome C [Rhodocyclaceae bacterium]